MQQNKNILLLVLSVIAVLLFFIITHKVYSNKFSNGDDYRIMVMNNPENISSNYKASCNQHFLNLIGSLQFDSEIGRFRPLSWLFVKAQTIIFGDKYSCYRYFNLFTLFLTTFFFLKLLNTKQISLSISILCLAFFIYGINAETWWSLIPPQQNIGELLVVISLFLLSNEKKASIVAGLTVAFLSAFVKESFAALLPFIFIYYYINETNFQKLIKTFVFLSFIPMILVGITIVYSNGVYGYETNENINNTIINNLWQLGLASLFFIAPISMLLSQKIGIKNLLLIIGAICTQLILLFKIKIDEQHHYLSPAIIIIILITAFSFQSIQKINLNFYRASFLFYLLFILYNIKNTYINSQYYAVKLFTFHQLLDSISNMGTNHYVFINHSGEENDWLRGFSIHLSQKNQNAQLSHFYKKNTSSNFFPSTTQINDSIKKVLFFELPNEKGKINYDIKQSSDSLLFYVDEKEFKLKGKRISFSNTYFDIGIKDLLSFNFTNKKELRYNAILTN
jgi:hypothetical protein